MRNFDQILVSVSELVAAAALRKERGALRVQLISSQSEYLKQVRRRGQKGHEMNCIWASVRAGL